MIDYDKLQRSLRHLEVQFDNWQRAKDRPELTELDRQAIGESVIQRFETCFDTLWKTLKRYLLEELGVADVPNAPKVVLRIAGQSNVLPSSVEQWLRYLDARNDTAHDYSEAKAEECLANIEDFVHDAIGLFETMSGAPWTR